MGKLPLIFQRYLKKKT